MIPLRIAIVVPGRLHAFELAAALQRQGHEVFVYSNYPVYEAIKFGLNPKTFHGNVLNRVVLRLWLNLFGHSRFQSIRDRIVCNWFDKWALRKIKKEQDFDVVHVFSGVALNILRYTKANKIYSQLVRGSAHIDTQTALLVSEAKRSGVLTDIPSVWMRQREKMEYELADRIIVLSQFALKSFMDQGKNLFSQKISIMSLGTDKSVFEPIPSVIEHRIKRIMSGRKLKVLMAGGLSAQKGAEDFIQTAAALADEMDFSFVGSAESQWQSCASERAPKLKFIARVPQQQLPKIYAEHDIFYFPTIQDGFAVVIAQALASGMCVIASENSAAPDLFDDGKNGFVVPAQQSDYSIELMRKLDGQRERLAEIVKAAVGTDRSRSWEDVATDLAEYSYQNKARK
jgi:glycosyltransferase involved in cell wall biosynthesis